MKELHHIFSKGELQLQCDGEGRMYINGKQVVTEDKISFKTREFITVLIATACTIVIAISDVVGNILVWKAL